MCLPNKMRLLSHYYKKITQNNKNKTPTTMGFQKSIAATGMDSVGLNTSDTRILESVPKTAALTS